MTKQPNAPKTPKSARSSKPTKAAPRHIDEPYPLSVRIPHELRNRILRLAQQHHRSITKEVIVALEAYAARQERILNLPPLPSPHEEPPQ